MSPFPRLFFVYRVFGCLFIAFQKHNGKRFTKKSCRKFLPKNRQNNPKHIFFLDLFSSRFWVFLGDMGEGSPKARFKKCVSKKSKPGPFLASDPPTYHVGHRFLFAGPLGSNARRGGENFGVFGCV
jgi:hypothetical protein